NSLHSGFVYDDIGVIEENYFIRSLHNIPKIFSKDYFHLSSELSYRPVVTLSYFADYAVWHLNPFGYHLTNIVLHTINSILLYALLVHLTRMRSVALLSAIIFSIHPCVTEAVNAISYREDIFVALFSLLSCLCLIKSTQRYLIPYPNTPTISPPQQEKIWTNNGQPNRSATQWRMIIYYALALITYLIELFSKETAIVTPLFILFYWFLCKREYLPSTPSVGKGTANPVFPLHSNGYDAVSPTKSREVKDFITWYAGYILISFFYLFVRFVILKNPLEVSPGYLKGSIAINFMTMTKVLATYVKLMFFPFRLSADYTIAPVLSVSDLSFITSVFLLTAVGVIIFKTINRGQEAGVGEGVTGVKGLPTELRSLTPLKGFMGKKPFLQGNTARTHRIYSLFMLCFFIALLPVLNIVPIGHIIAERYLYFPVIGFCTVMGGLLLGKLTVRLPGNTPQSPYKPGALKGLSEEKAKKSAGAKRFLPGNTVLNKFIFLPLLVMLCISFTTRTILRNRDWQNEFTFWTTILKEQPQNYDAHNNLGNYFYKQGKLDRAIRELEEAVRLKQNYPEGHNSLGTMYIDKGLIDKAIAEYVEAIKYKPVFPQAYYNLGNACIKKGLLDNGITYFQKAVSMGMHNPQVFNNLGSAYIKKGMLDEAIAQYKKAIAVYNDYAEVHSNLGYVYTEKGDLDKAASELNHALELQPNHANAHNNLGAVYCQKGLFDKAQQEFLLAIRYDPKNASAHKNIGMIYFAKGYRQKAREHLLQMLQYDPGYINDANIFTIVSQLGLIKE
ncbi:MAG: tetratricopeptide repeat protein, partial [Candidatus Brocadia sp.]